VIAEYIAISSRFFATPGAFQRRNASSEWLLAFRGSRALYPHEYNVSSARQMSRALESIFDRSPSA
jgi:hypothetical protein